MSEHRMALRLVIVAVIAVYACDVKPKAAVPYSVVLKNCTGGKVTDAVVSYGLFKGPAGSIGPGAEKTRGLVSDPIAENAEVAWRALDGSEVRRITKLRGALPPDFAHDEIVFEICDGGEVHVRARANPAANVRVPGSWRANQESGSDCCGKSAPQTEATGAGTSER